MRRIGLTIWLYILRSLIYVKRFLVWFFRIFVDIFDIIANAFQNTLGFRLYKWYLILKRRFGISRVPVRTRASEFFTRRSTMQVLLFVIGIAVMIPHSSLYTSDDTGVPGRDSLLFALVGPTDEIEWTDEVYLTLEASATTPEPAAWREGAVSTISPSTVGIERPTELREIAGVSAGGSALLKPVIAPNAVLPSADGTSPPAPTGRTEIVQYQVQPGDVIGSIAQRFGVSVETILWANDLSIRSYIRPGDILEILPVSGLLHTVKSGETLGKIVRTYDADQDRVIEFNKLQAGGADIRIGEQLVIPDGRRPQPTVVYRPPTVAPTQVSQVAAPPPSISVPAGTSYIWPTSVRRITQYFGWRHTGVDIAGPSGSPLYAARAGTVTKSQCGWNGGYGCYVIIDHGGGVQTLYAHASALYVSVGQSVSQGQTVAAMGSTGRSTGPHIHFEIRVNGARQNPLQYVR